MTISDKMLTKGSETKKICMSMIQTTTKRLITNFKDLKAVVWGFQ